MAASLAKGAGTASPEASKSPTSPIWQAALEKYYSELARGGIKTTMIDKEVWTIQCPDELLAQIEGLDSVQKMRADIRSKTLSQLHPLLLGLGDFAALAARVMGMNGKVAAVLLGSIRLIIKFAHSVLPDVVEELQGLQHALPRIRKYEEELPMTSDLEKALVDMYSEIIVFCSYAIAFFHNNPNVGRNPNVWAQFSGQCSRVVTKIRKLSRRLDELPGLARLSREKSTVETTAVPMGQQALRIPDDFGAKLPCFMIPYGLNLRFSGRSAELQTLREELDPNGESRQLKAIGIHGLGGVGKSQLALQYANTSMDKFEVIAWIPAETRVKLIQAMSSLSTKLQLTEGNGEGDAKSIQKVRDWLNIARRPFLLIFDNVESVAILDEIWPASPTGSIIITTRSPSQASKRAATTLALSPFTVETGTGVLRSLTGVPPTDESDSAAAEEICRRIGGLPLAMVQLSDFIRDRGYSYIEFLEVYEKSAEKLYAKLEGPLEYGHTVLTTWDISLQKLSDEAKKLQSLLIFFDPDSLPERLITDTKAEIEDEGYLFLFDEFDFGEAVMELSRTSLIRRLASSRALSMHRLVQFAVFLRLPKSERIVNFDLAVKILYFGFPNTWQARGPHQGHGWAAWETCSAILPHVSWLMQLSEKHKIKSAHPELWAELVFRTGTYLWEKEQPSLARSFFEFGLKLDNSLPLPLVAQAHRLLGHISLDLARPRAGLAAYSQALALRSQIEPPESPPIADVLDSLACANVEAGDVATAFEQLDRATAIHQAHDPSKMSRTLAIRAMACLRAGDPDGALAALRECWRLQGLAQHQVEASRYPKHSGDIMLLARIRWLQGRRAEAQELASRTIAMRRGIFGGKGGPRVADSLFTVARMLEEGGERVLASRMLREVLEICGDAPETRPHLARALWFVAGVEESLGADKDEVEGLRARAKEVRESIEGREWEDEDTDDGFMRLVSWMLW
ncbi:hypothetical protein VTK56DRAFT_4628 [Thermocarpiscus australiensis]